jgi:hypothetical protein
LGHRHAFGKAVPQNGKGHLLGHIVDLGRDVADTSARTYQTNARQLYHTDSCDIVSLLCVQKAKTGGLSSLVSSVTIYNEMLKRYPDLVKVLFTPFQTDRREEVPSGRKPFYSVPIFNWYEDLFTAQYTRRYVESAQRFPEVGPYSPIRMEALNTLDAMANDPALNLHMAFEPGDMQFVHNHQIMHDRTAYEDWPGKKRHLLRLWLCPPNGRPLPPVFEEKLNGPPTIGDRGGIRLAGATPNVPLEPE